MFVYLERARIGGFGEARFAYRRTRGPERPAPPSGFEAMPPPQPAQARCDRGGIGEDRGGGCRAGEISHAERQPAHSHYAYPLGLLREDDLLRKVPNVRRIVMGASPDTTRSVARDRRSGRCNRAATAGVKVWVMTACPPITVGCLEEHLATEVGRKPVEDPSRSGSRLERIWLEDGSTRILKTQLVANDWLARRTCDTGRFHCPELLDRVGRVIDHCTIDVSSCGGGWQLLQRDVSTGLVPQGSSISLDAFRSLFRAVDALHDELDGQPVDGLCPLANRYLICSPAAEAADGDPRALATLREWWGELVEIVPDEVADAVISLLCDPTPLAEALSQYDSTLLHGDLKLENAAFFGDKPALFDWGSMTGLGPRWADWAFFIVSLDRVVGDMSIPELAEAIAHGLGPNHDDQCRDLALMGCLTQFGALMGVHAAGRVPAWYPYEHHFDLQFFVAAARRALDRWSPSLKAGSL